MKRFVRRAAVIAALLAVPTPAGTPAFAAPSTPAKTAAGTTARFETEVVRLTNVQRTAKGCAALRIDDRLSRAARAHSADMVAARFFDHTGSDGSTFVAREAAAGYPRKGASAENIAWGYRTPAQVVSGWMKSPGHRANILNCGSVAVGVGVAYTGGGAPYWTQDFGRI
ncbi:hypothetical protein GCM10010172_50160 [Paractinoplanes ferrugineus]|uniref:SCP domain-containing protein n=1 Tax=Paractinoplanes ferrugineus TaxID=113564 RepID=A0A919MPW7_9ACTN|nr:CAP domain-containing protein [Actinoplanes ferrugineus]GIE15722.1 hypothetical protein Afe05nite_75620 [Actinoplanes ferrugineus]